MHIPRQKRPWTRFTMLYTMASITQSVAPICTDSNDFQIRYGQLVGLTYYVWGRPRVRFRGRVSLYPIQAFSIQSHQPYCTLAPFSRKAGVSDLFHLPQLWVVSANA
jgi:hypothetical protein